MIRLEYLNLSLGTVVLRYYLLMLIVIAAGFSGQPIIGLLALPVFLSALLGITIKFGNNKKSRKIRQLPNEERLNAA